MKRCVRCKDYHREVERCKLTIDLVNDLEDCITELQQRVLQLEEKSSSFINFTLLMFCVTGVCMIVFAIMMTI